MTERIGWSDCSPLAKLTALGTQFHTGTLFGMPHGMELELADEICARFPVEMVRFANSGSECTMHALRLVRSATGRSKIVKMEGGYHGGHDAVSVSVKPKEGQFGDPQRPKPVVSSLGVLKGTADATLVAPIKVGKGAYVGAASCITDDVPPDSLALGRAKQIVKEGWVKNRRGARA